MIRVDHPSAGTLNMKVESVSEHENTSMSPPNQYGVTFVTITGKDENGEAVEVLTHNTDKDNYGGKHYAGITEVK